MTSESSIFTVDCTALAVTPSDKWRGLLAVSLVGPETAIKAIRAALWEPNCKVKFKAEGADGVVSDYETISKFLDTRYEAACVRLGLHTMHMVAVAETPGLLRSISDVALWREFRSTRFTTPLLRGWVPWLRKFLIEKERLVPAACFGDCGVGILKISAEELDKVVTHGVKLGHLEFREGGAA